MALKLVQHLRDEAHRFGLSHHRNKRSKGAIGSELDSIKGLGPKTVETLFREFKTISALQTATSEEVAKKIGASKTRLLFEYLRTIADQSQ